MRKPVVISAAEAADMIPDNSTLCGIQMTQISACTSILKAIEKKYLEEGRPRNLTYVHTCGQASAGNPGGLQHIAHEGLITRVIGGH